MVTSLTPVSLATCRLKPDYGGADEDSFNILRFDILFRVDISCADGEALVLNESTTNLTR